MRKIWRWLWKKEYRVLEQHTQEHSDFWEEEDRVPGWAHYEWPNESAKREGEAQ